jgi:hypothetical protein
LTVGDLLDPRRSSHKGSFIRARANLDSLMTDAVKRIQPLVDQ